MSDALDLQLELLKRLRPLTRSGLPYTVLWQVVRSPAGLETETERALRIENRNAGRALEMLAGEGLIAKSGERWVPTAAGRHLVRELEKATNAPPASVIEGCRLLSVAVDHQGSLAEAERLLAKRGAEVLYADGPYELIALLPDDHALVRELREQLHEKGHRVSALRIVSRD